jgi:hypothetical protein
MIDDVIISDRNINNINNPLPRSNPSPTVRATDLVGHRVQLNPIVAGA